MFTGIVQAACPILSVMRKPSLHTIGIAMPPALSEGLSTGASVAIDGVCLTVTGRDELQVYFDLMADTLRSTTLANLSEGSRVNVERSMRQGDEIGGHPLSGHVDATASIMTVERQPNIHRVRYQPPPRLMKYLLPKGFVALNGCSLTIAAADAAEGWFEVSYIPETLRVTTHGDLGPGDAVNLEVDRQTQAIVETVERIMASHLQSL